MEKEKFDKLIQNKIASHDIHFERMYNRERSWKAINKNRNRGLWYKLAAAMVICALSFGLIFNKSADPVLSKVNKSQTTKPSFKQPEPFIQKPEKFSVSDPAVLASRGQKVSTIEEKAMILPGTVEPDTTVTKALPKQLAAETVAMKPSDIAQEKEDIKITFRRGGQAEVQDIKVSLSRGQKIKFDFFKKQAYDSTTYVANENPEPKQPIRLNF